MASNLGRYVNKTIFVSITGVAEDGKCRPYKLIGIELVGLWLQSEDLTSRYIAYQNQSTPLTWAMFIPFSQIACVAVAAPSSATQPGAPLSADRRKVQPAPANQSEPPPTTPAATRKSPKQKDA
jgi:hypothetical protein